MVHLAQPEGEVQLVFPFWILRDRGSIVLIDTGFPQRVCEARGITNYTDPQTALASIGIDPKEIDTIIVSHMHWDHFCAPERFPNAKFVIQEDEVMFFTGLGRDYPTRHSADLPSLDAVAALRAQGRLQIVDGETRIADDLWVFRVGGHTPGMQITVYETGKGPTVFACDASHLYENLVTRTPTSLIYSYDEYQRGFTLIEELAAGGNWFPGHDPKMLDGLEPVGGCVYRLAQSGVG